jgi:hypothetical protein
VSQANDPAAMDWLRRQFVGTALRQLHLQATTARAVFGRDPIYIWLIHATPLAADCLDDILAAFQRAGVEFVGLEDAMADPLNQKDAPLITPRFLNHVQKWAVHRGLTLEDVPPAVLEEVERLHPTDGLAYGELMARVFKAVADEVGGQFERKRY